MPHDKPKRKVGRPRASQPRSARVMLRFSLEEYDTLQSMANGRDLARVLRDCIFSSNAYQHYKLIQSARLDWAPARQAAVPPVLQSNEARLKRTKQHLAAPDRPEDAALLEQLSSAIPGLDLTPGYPERDPHVSS